jgi:hypothetical protein
VELTVGKMGGVGFGVPALDEAAARRTGFTEAPAATASKAMATISMYLR